MRFHDSLIRIFDVNGIDRLDMTLIVLTGPLNSLTLTLILLFTTAPTFANSVDLDQMADQDLHCHSVCEFEQKQYMV